MKDAQVVGRLAPSPTGLLHVGHARSFLAAWWSARAAGGRVVLRIEDLDATRCRPKLRDAALRDLEWLGLDWDALHVQSEDLEPYEEAVDRLLEAGAAYPCTCSRKEILSALSAPHAHGEELRYPGTCRGRYPDVASAEQRSGAVAGVRLRVPPGPHAIRDRRLGSFAAEPQAECGDFLLLRRDGAVAYQLAVVVDDARQGVTEVVRGDDLLPSAVRQRLLCDALGLPFPTQLHLPLVVDPGGRRLSKRDRDLDLESLREAGADPRVIVGWVAESLGLPPRDGLAAAVERAAEFDVARIPDGVTVLDAATKARLRGR